MKKNDLGIEKPKTGESFFIAFLIILAMLFLAGVVWFVLWLFSVAPVAVGIIIGAGAIWTSLAMMLKHTPWGRALMYGKTDKTRAEEARKRAEYEEKRSPYRTSSLPRY